MPILNSTHYWTDTSRFFNEVPDSNSFLCQSSRRESYYLRLFWEFEYTKLHHGKAFFVTFTYNDKSIPKLYGYPVFDYSHIRLITNGVISKRLFRDYGCSLRYFCSCESGSGGTSEHHARGLGNNPHYHFIFFVCPSGPDSILISNEDFFALCQEVWQGKSGYIPWQKARFGSVKAGKFGIEVQDIRALKYVSKYCVKDNGILTIERSISDIIYKSCFESQYSFSYFKSYYNYLKSFNSSLSISYFLGLFDAAMYFELRRRENMSISDYFDKYTQRFVRTNDPHFYPFVTQNVVKYRKFFIDTILPDLFNIKWNDFKNKHSGKVRCSKSLGSYGISQVLLPDTDPHFKVLDTSGYKTFKLPLYYIRHLYYDVVICPHTGNPLYCLNNRGKNLKLLNFHLSVSKLYNSTLTNISTLINNNLHFESDVFKSDAYFQAFNLRISTDFLRIVNIYALYSLVYKYRCYNKSVPIRLDSDFKFSDILEDYDFFLDQDRFKFDFEEGNIFCLFSRRPDSQFFDEVNHFIHTVRSDIKKENFALHADASKKLCAYEVNVSNI